MTDASPWARFFDRHAPEYDNNCFTQNTTAEVDFLIDVLGLAPGATVLDVGCGTGRHAVELARRSYAVTGLDLSAGMLEQARKKADAAGVELVLRQANAKDFTFDTPFDAAINLCEGAFGLLGNDDDPIEQPLAILRNIAAALKPGAPCLFTVLSAYRMARRHTDEGVAEGTFDPLTVSEPSDCGITRETGCRERGFVPTELRLLFQSAGLDVQHIWGGTAGNWGKRPIELDEYEIMVVALNAAE